MNLTDEELCLIMLALWTYTDSFEGDYDDDCVKIDALYERLRKVAVRRRRKEVSS